MSAEHDPVTPSDETVPAAHGTAAAQPLWPASSTPGTATGATPDPVAPPGRSRWRGMVATPGRAAVVAVAATLVLAVVPCTLVGAVAGAAIVGEHHDGESGDGDRHGEQGDREGQEGQGDEADQGGGQEQRQPDKGPASTAVPPPSSAAPTVSPSQTP
ncbi:hypothetical protein [Dactylosporangium sp. NPDC005555]|uniref:hypothetical protein n=1 Tax=Dactylosporangium sp. NPDC005555 TaxID=3154889 RepID=UPI0033B16549